MVVPEKKIGIADAIYFYQNIFRVIGAFSNMLKQVSIIRIKRVSLSHYIFCCIHCYLQVLLPALFSSEL